jgi:RecA-family ATPase
MLETLPKRDWLIKDIMREQSFGVLWGEPSTFKTFIAISMSVCIAAGTDWLGKATKKGQVLYVVAEGVYGLNNRLKAFEKKHGFAPTNIMFLVDAFNLTDQTDMLDLQNAIDKLEDDGRPFKPDLNLARSSLQQRARTRQHPTERALIQ